MNLVGIITTIATLIPALIGIFGNSLVLISVKKFEWLKTPTFYFVALLAFFDFCSAFPAFAFVTPVIFGGSSSENATLGYKVGCKVLVGIGGFSGAGNFLCLLVITIERYLYITKPLRYINILTNTKALIISVLVILVALSLNINGLRYKVVIPCNTHRMFSPDAVKYVAIPMVCIILLMIIALYGKIAHISWKVRKSAMHPMPQKDKSGSQNKITKVMSLVIGAFTMTYLTYFTAFQLTKNKTGPSIIWIQRSAAWIWLVSLFFFYTVAPYKLS